MSEYNYGVKSLDAEKSNAASASAYESQAGKTQKCDRYASTIIGKHVYGNLYGVPHTSLTNAARLEYAVRKAADYGNAHIVDTMIKKFPPMNGFEGGVSIIALLEESHISLHTWPEGEYATLDVYTCGNTADPDAVFSYIVKELKPKRFKLFRSDRSMIKERQISVK
ncbi:MAG: adenosylmethionine decarboxylase [Candidatus Micrarchaeia archaeon]